MTDANRKAEAETKSTSTKKKVPEMSEALVSKQPETAIVQKDRSEMFGEDGRLLRMFVVREEHRKPDARNCATQRWLIRGDFFDQHVEEFASLYAPPKKYTDEELLASEIMFPSWVRQVEKLENTMNTAADDVHQLRDVLLTAVKELTTPRRILHKGGEKAMSEEVRAALKLKEQTRLRQLVYDCLKKIWSAGVGGDVLRLALEQVRHRIMRFEFRCEGSDKSVENAMAGEQWARLQELVASIDDDLRAQAGESEPREPRPGLKVAQDRAGRGTCSVIERALQALDGEASYKQIVQWVEGNPEILADCKKVVLNTRTRSSKAGAKKGVEAHVALGRPVWHSTLASMLSFRCHRVGEKGSSKYRLKENFSPAEYKRKQQRDAQPVADGDSRDSKPISGAEAAAESIVAATDTAPSDALNASRSTAERTPKRLRRSDNAAASASSGLNGGNGGSAAVSASAFVAAEGLRPALAT
eukprot:TRINITY_DN75493_c0_g1_i1.p1 TRINITY_DN75493_c0_g1~~TRINITY_DN75493_c0_g1_i1.p1  ORF type:complete len:528 (-),score=112.82 TRINITY_DN75493_c0_g1_i1:191-1606(-)